MCGSDARPLGSKTCFGQSGGTVSGLLKLFPGSETQVPGVRGIVSDFPATSVGVTAWVLDSQKRAVSLRENLPANPSVSSLKRANVVVLVDRKRSVAAQAALDDLD